MDSTLNISAYRFVTLDDAAVLRERLLEQAQALALKGTILLAREGINLFLAGPPGPVRRFVEVLHGDPRFAGLEPKESWSARVPFRRLRVKVKHEIIRMNHPAIRPEQQRAPALPAATVKRWLDAGVDDAGRPVVTLDTRNGFEVDQGGFEGAIDWRIHRFSDFPAALREHRQMLADKTVVSYCTGGIRCEKAVILMREMGLEHAYQLDGGILKYFEEVGSAHYRGSCFVFDERETLGPDLDERALVGTGSPA
ncbi:MAG: sulfurtransferase [Rhodoferax sp.]|nr:sulfurtransferase [Rhodoferax sp.]